MKFSELMQSMTFDGSGCQLQAPDDWMQGRSVYGGLQAAVIVAAMRRLIPADQPLRSLQMTFIAPVNSSMNGRAQILRSGKHTTHVEARLMGGANVLAQAIAVFGYARDSAVKRTPVQAPIVNPGSRVLPFVAGISPNFMQQFTARWLRGDLPFSNSSKHDLAISVDMHDDVLASESHLMALADYVPPVAFSMLSKPVFGSSLTWMLEVLTESYRESPLKDWRMDAEMCAAADGYTHQSTMIWGPDGTPVALSRQTMVVFG